MVAVGDVSTFKHSDGRSRAAWRSGRAVACASCVTTSPTVSPSGGGRRRGGGSSRSSSPPCCSSGWWCSSSASMPIARRGWSPRRSSPPLLAAAAVIVTWLESRRITGHLNRTIDRLIDTESELRLLLDDLPEGVMSVDDDGVVGGANAKAAELTGPQHARRSPARRRWSSTATSSPTGWPPVGAVTPSPRSRCGCCMRNEPTPTVVEANVDLPRQADGAVVVRLRDVTEREERVRALEQARRRFQQAFHSAPDRHGARAARRLDDHRRQPLAGRHAGSRPVADLVGRSIREVTHPDDLRAAAAHRARLELGIADTYLLDQRYLRSDGEFVWARTRVAVTEDEGVSLAITHIEDVTEQRRTAERLQWAATHDDLTGLPNRTELIARVDALLEQAANGRRGAAVHRPRQLQGGQRQPRARHRRHAADGDDRPPAGRRRATRTSSPASVATSSSSS